MGLLEKTWQEYFQGVGIAKIQFTAEAVGASTITEDGINLLIAERNEAKKQKNFARADEIRDQLKSHGVLLEDGPGGTTWKRV